MSVELQTRNEVVLVGRVSGEPAERELPSGDVIVTWRVVVDRPPPRATDTGGRAQSIDTIDCVAWKPGARRTARGYVAGDVVAVEGALRRRFWRGGGALASRCEVEVAVTRRMARAPAG